MDAELEISLADIMKFLKKRFILIVLCGIYAMAGSFIISNYFIKEEFTAQVLMYVAPNADEMNRVASLSELNYAQAVVDTYIEILRTDTFLNDVAEASEVSYTPGQLRGMVTMASVNGTEIFRIRVVSNSPEEAHKLAETMADLAPQKIIEIKDADAVRVVDPASMPTEPSSPNILRNTILGFMLGVMLGLGISLLIELADKRIKGEEDLTRSYDLPVLGVIPFND